MSRFALTLTLLLPALAVAQDAREVRLDENAAAEPIAVDHVVFGGGVHFTDLAVEGVEALEAEAVEVTTFGGTDPDIQAATVYHCVEVPGGVNVPPGGTHWECSTTSLPTLECAQLGYTHGQGQVDSQGGVWFCEDHTRV